MFVFIAVEPWLVFVFTTIEPWLVFVFTAVEPWLVFVFTAIEPWLVFTNRYMYYIRKLSLDGRYFSLLQQGLGNSVAMDFDYADERLYFIDVQVRCVVTAHK